ncbi:hypothetical protein A3Q29_11305 [Providencia stuartii]|uniref:Lipoprotein n=1 Tax=Providencia stuartii TaxID=588 RepID=A0A1S1HMA5_PROST|nr:hypothetical protein A3Q29_11305 [Providencia stuartii]
MKKLLIAAAIASTTLLFGCSDEKQKIIDSVVSYLEVREDMFPYRLEFKDLNFIPNERGNFNSGELCGEVKISQKTSIKPKELPRIFFSNIDGEIQNVINSNDYFKFLYAAELNAEKSKEIKPIMIIHPYDKAGMELWDITCKRQ